MRLHRNPQCYGHPRAGDKAAPFAIDASIAGPVGRCGAKPRRSRPGFRESALSSPTSCPVCRSLLAALRLRVWVVLLGVIADDASQRADCDYWTFLASDCNGDGTQCHFSSPIQVRPDHGAHERRHGSRPSGQRSRRPSRATLNQTSPYHTASIAGARRTHLRSRTAKSATTIPPAIQITARLAATMRVLRLPDSGRVTGSAQSG